jgi:hypothetical protein
MSVEIVHVEGMLSVWMYGLASSLEYRQRTWPTTMVRQLSPPRSRDRIGTGRRAARVDLGVLSGPSPPDAVGARNGSQRVQLPSDVARPNQIYLPGQWLSIRLSPR